MNDYLSRDSLLRLIAVLALVIAPHAGHLPAWEILLIVTAMAWRALIALRQWRLPSLLPRTALTLAGFGGVYASYHSISGQSAGTALLCAMTALKLLEMRARRDVMIVVLLMYFILVTHFLFSQDLWTIAYLLVCAVAITALLMDCNHPGNAVPVRPLLRRATIMVAQSLPLMLAMFILFPRIPGPLWGLPSDTGAHRSGLSDSMMPGDIEKLILSDAVAFRVHFDGPAPPQDQRYWRGPVFDRFDGRKWSPRIAPQQLPPEAVELTGAAVDYDLTLEPTQQRWIFALDLPAPTGLPAATSLHGAGQLLADKPVGERVLYRLRSYPHYRLQPALSPFQRRMMLQLPANADPRSRALAAQWRAQQTDDAQIVQQALRMFRSEPFYYTLHPPKLGADSVDEFLFDTRRGFCEHYASSFTFLMRAAGIPARVVTGYQGGEKNAYGDYYVIHQYDAHAWSEVWLDGRGWVRVDPTAAVAPNRVEEGLASALTAADGLPSFLQRQSQIWLNLSARWDWLNNRWNRWVLAYGPELQADFLSHFGITDWSQMILVLTVAITLLLSAVGLSLLRQFAPVQRRDDVLRQWQRAIKPLRKLGLQQAPHEGPQDFAARVIARQPLLESSMQRVLDAYLRLRYFDTTESTAQQSLRMAVDEFIRKISS
ncbi:MAG: transglutaminase TgpA family protein [Stenotrophobium sp.]